MLLFAPGYGWLPTDYGRLLETLAGQGWVVIAAAPPALVPIVPLADGGSAAGEPFGDATSAAAAADLLLVFRNLPRLGADPGLAIAALRLAGFAHGSFLDAAALEPDLLAPGAVPVSERPAAPGSIRAPG